MPRNASTEIGQRRKYTFQGVGYPSVTTILKLGTPKEWLGAWAAKMVAEEAVYGSWGYDFKEPEDAVKYLKGAPWRKRDAAAAHGSSVHDVLEALAYGRDIPTDALGWEQIEQWRDAYRPDIHFSESQVVNTEVGYAGSLDLIADIYGKRYLIDLKTSKVLDNSMRLQLAAYRYAESVFEDDRVICAMPEVEACAVLWIPREKPHEWMFCEVPAGAEAWAAFLHVKGVHDFTRRTEKQSVGEIVLPQAREAA